MHSDSSYEKMDGNSLRGRGREVLAVVYKEEEIKREALTSMIGNVMLCAAINNCGVGRRVSFHLRAIKHPTSLRSLGR